MKPTFEVWFYIGVLLGLYGVMLTLAGTYQWVHLPGNVLAERHATFWAGVSLLSIGGAYTVAYWPRSVRKSRAASRPEPK